MNFLYDIGRVLLDFEFESSLSRLLPADCKDPRARLEQLLQRKDEFEAGKVGPDAYIDWALGVLGGNANADQFRDAWRNIFTPNEPMWECVRKLAAKGHRLILFSNTNSIHCPWIFENYPEFSLFENAVLSHEVGAIKPQAKIYEHALGEHGLEPSSTLYIDDLQENIAAGRAHGLHCWQYDLRDHASFEKWLGQFDL
jgi:HAD superfamily hydrolase (TIGR01509 family)